MKPFKHPLRALALGLALGGCASLPPYAKVEGQLRDGRYAEAAKAVAEAEGRYGGSSRLLYYFDRAWAEHLAGHYALSNEFVEKADALMAQLYTKSLGREALSFLSNDMSLAYEGENFERVMLHTVGMLNYTALGQLDEALVEARRADERMRQYVERAGPDKIAYAQDALSRYLSAVLYESQGGQSRWDAYLDYKKCDEAFGLYAKAFGTAEPRLLQEDLLRLSGRLGEGGEHESFAARFGELQTGPVKGKTAVIVILREGLAPVKVSETLNLPVILGDGTQQYFSAAFPRFVPRMTGFASAELSVDGAPARPLELFQDLQAIAIRDLQDRVALIRVKAIARATAKFQAAREIQRQARQAGGEGAQLLAILGTNLYGIISEQADIRSWRTLPGRIHLSKVFLEPGRHHLALKISGPGGFQERDLGELVLGQKPVILEAGIP